MCNMKSLALELEVEHNMDSSTIGEDCYKER